LPLVGVPAASRAILLRADLVVEVGDPQPKLGGVGATTAILPTTEETEGPQP
jgi:hypothetical protein